MTNQTSGLDSKLGIETITGVHAPASGWWRPADDSNPFRYLQRGDLMPSLEGNRTKWVLDYALPPSRCASVTAGGA